MLNKERFSYIALIVVLISILVWFAFSGNEEYVDAYNAQIEALEKKVDSLHSENNELTFKIDTLNTQITQLDQQLDFKNNRINNLKNEINSKVNAVDDFNNDELKRFFTERYGQYLDSIRKTNSKVSN
tara:strand:+ start:1211 stop:1594 length:384 start_codon:yes stop_codon:yes gene_type:complete